MLTDVLCVLLFRVRAKSHLRARLPDRRRGDEELHGHDDHCRGAMAREAKAAGVNGRFGMAQRRIRWRL